MFLNSKDDKEINEIFQQKQSNVCNTVNKPLSPVLSSLNRRRVHLKKGNVKSRVKLSEKYQQSSSEHNLLDTPAQKFTNDSFRLSQTDNLITRLEELEEIERNRNAIYNVFSSGRYDDSCFKRPLSPSRIIQSKKRNNLQINLNKLKEVSNENIESIVEPLKSNNVVLDNDELLNRSHFSTAGGKYVVPSDSAIKKYSKLFDDIFRSDESCDIPNNKFHFLSKNKSKDISKAVQESSKDLKDVNTIYIKDNISPYKDNVNTIFVKGYDLDNKKEDIQSKDEDLKHTLSLTQQISDSGISNSQILYAANKLLNSAEEQSDITTNCLGFTKIESEETKLYYQYFHKCLSSRLLILYNKIDLSKSQQDKEKCAGPPLKKIKLDVLTAPKVDNVPYNITSNSKLKMLYNLREGDTISKSNGGDFKSFGFTSASGKSIKVSDFAADKVSNIFDDLYDYNNKNIDNKQKKIIMSDSNKIGKVSYSTVTTSKVQEINKKKLNLLDQMIGQNSFVDVNFPIYNFYNSTANIIDDSSKLNTLFQHDLNKNDGDSVSTDPMANGFCSASDKNRQTTKIAAKKAYTIFEDLYESKDHNIINKQQTCKIKQPSTNISEKTCLDKSLISSSKLRDINKKKLNLFDDMIENNSLNYLNTPKVPFSNSIGLNKIGNSSPIKTSEFTNREYEKNYSIKNNAISYGFSSASGKNIKISEAAFAKAGNVFDDLCDIKDSNIDINIQSSKKISKFDDNLKKVQNTYNHKLSTSFKHSFELNREKNLVSPLSRTNMLSTLRNVEVNIEMEHTPVKFNRQISQNSSKRKLGMSFCKQISVSDTKLKRARLLFDEDLNGISPIKPNNSDLQTSSTLLQDNYSSTPIKVNKDEDEKAICSSQTVTETCLTNQCTCSRSSLDAKIVFDSPTKDGTAEWIKKVEDDCQNLENRLKILQLRQKLLNDISNPMVQIDRKPREGYLYRKKKSEKRLALSEVSSMGENSVVNYLNEISPYNAQRVHFLEQTSSVLTKDGAIVIPNNNDLIGLSEIEFAFKNISGVEPSLIPNGWIKNHFKWIIWKLASYDRVLPNYFDQCFSVENVIQQLKYRYDREIDKAERSALRKIYEKDDVPQKRMVLCVSNIKQVHGRYELELTDGWYSIKTVIDDLLCIQVHNGKIRVGTKLITCGALLLNCDGCYPLEATDLIYLKINYNSTRRGKWYMRLGYQDFPGPFPIPIHSIHPSGGLIGAIKICIVRVYPFKYLEKIGNQSIWRNKRAEERRAQVWENERCKKIEQIQNAMKKEFISFSKSENKNFSRLNHNVNIAEIKCPEQLLNILEYSNDPDSIEQKLTPSQKSSILEFKRKKDVKIQQEINDNVQSEIQKLKMTRRDVKSSLKLLIVDVDGLPNRIYNFFVWNPNESHLQILKEGTSFIVDNVLPQKNGDLSATNKTIFRPLTRKVEIANIYIRKVTNIENLWELRSGFREFDTVGLVVASDFQENVQDIWLTDASGRLLLVEVLEGPNTCLLLDNVRIGQVISVCNLIYKGCQENVAQAIANHCTVFSSYSQFRHLQEGLDLFVNLLPKNLNDLLKDCSNKIEKYKMKSHCSITENSEFSENDDDTLVSSRLSTTDVALSLIDIESLK